MLSAHRLFLRTAFAVLLFHATVHAQEFGAWKEKTKIKLAGPITLGLISDDKSQVVTIHQTTGKIFTGMPAPKVFQVNHLNVHSTDKGTLLFKEVLDEIGWLLAFRSGRLAYTEAISDRVQVIDCATWKKIATLDCRNATDNPPGANQNVPALLKDFGGGGRIGDIEFSGDGKHLAVVRMESGEWKKQGNRFSGTSYQQLVLWDVDKAEKVAKLDHKSEAAGTGGLMFVRSRDQILVKFDDALRIFDIAKKEWSPLPSPGAFSTSLTADDKLLAVSTRDNTVRILDLDAAKELVSFKEKGMLKTKNLDPNLVGMLQAGPFVQFLEGDRTLKVTLNDGKTVVYRNLKGETIAAPPTTDTLKLSGRVLAVSRDKTMALTSVSRTSPICSVMVRDLLPSGSKK